LIDEKIMRQEDIKSSDDFIFDKLKKRCEELIKKYPEKRKLFTDYIQKQIRENDVLENKVTCSAMVIRRKFL
jgi:hypothetical protein